MTKKCKPVTWATALADVRRAAIDLIRSELELWASKSTWHIDTLKDVKCNLLGLRLAIKELRRRK